MLQRGEDVFAMSLREVRHSRRERADEVLDAFCRPRRGWGRCLQERFERHPDDVRRPASEAPRRSAERTTERSWQADRNLVVHKASNRALQL